MLPTVYQGDTRVPSTIHIAYVDRMFVIAAKYFHTSVTSHISNICRDDLVPARGVPYNRRHGTPCHTDIARQTTCTSSTSEVYVRYEYRPRRSLDHEMGIDRPDLSHVLTLQRWKMVGARIAGREYHCLEWPLVVGYLGTWRSIPYLSIVSQGHLASLAPSAGLKTILRVTARPG